MNQCTSYKMEFPLPALEFVIGPPIGGFLCVRCTAKQQTLDRAIPLPFDAAGKRPEVELSIPGLGHFRLALRKGHERDDAFKS